MSDLSDGADEPPPMYDPARKKEFERFREQMRIQKRIRDILSKIRRKIVVMSGKGGVGKTTVAVNLALALAKRGCDVGILDLDLTGPDVPKMLGLEDSGLRTDGKHILPVETSHGMKVLSLEFLLERKDMPVIWRGPMKIGAIQQFITDVEWGELEYLVIDLPPGTSDEPLTVAQMIPDTDGALIVTTPQEVSLLDISKSVNFARMVGMNVLGVVENMGVMPCPHCGREIDLFGSGGGSRISRTYGVPFLGSIPLDPRIVSGGDEGEPFVEVLPDSPAGRAFGSITEKLLALIEARDPA